MTNCTSLHFSSDPTNAAPWQEVGHWGRQRTEAGKEERKLCHPLLQVGIWGELYLRTHRKIGQKLRLVSLGMFSQAGVVCVHSTCQLSLNQPLLCQCSSLSPAAEWHWLKPPPWSSLWAGLSVLPWKAGNVHVSRSMRVQMTRGSLHWPLSLRWNAVG